MSLVTSYQALRKKNLNGRFLLFQPLRAVGLALETGWKLSRDKGSAAVCETDVGQVSVTGELQLLEGQRWRASSACTLQLQGVDSALALALLRKQRAFLADLGFNVWRVDWRPSGGTVTYDLLGDFSTARNHGVEGRLWVELKVFSDSSFGKEVDKTKAELAAALGLERQRDPTLSGVMLLAARVSKAGRGRWGEPTLLATLLRSTDTNWLDLSGVRRVARGQCRTTKPSLKALWSKMEWFETRAGDKVGLLKHFLSAMDVFNLQPGERAATYNKLLRQRGFQGRVFEARLANKAGRPPWVATKDTFRELYTVV